MLTQYKVAIELGYAPALVRKVLRRQHFDRAGDLVDYLWGIEFADDSNEKKEEEGTPQPTFSLPYLPMTNSLEIENEKKSRQQSLREETLQLYFQSQCLCCREKERNIVCLPCSHLTLCARCATMTSHCPAAECHEKIKDTIVAFLS